MSDFRFPSDSERTSIVGRTGSGKTQQGAWVLSHANYDEIPWMVLDFKGDDLLNSITNAQHKTLHDKLPKHPGVYIVHAHPHDEDGIENFLMKLWERENIGLFIDEGYMVPRNSAALGGILTQGRSKKIPAIILSQRPAWLNRFVLSEADHYSVFHLNFKGDRKKVGEYLPEKISLDENPKEYHSHWYDVKRNRIFMMQPAESRDTILERFDLRLKPKRKLFL